MLSDPLSCVTRPGLDSFSRAQRRIVQEGLSTLALGAGLRNNPVMDDGRLVLEELTPSQCLALIAAGGLGRVGINVEALPVILPVDFALLDNDIVVRTVPGTKLNAALAGAVVAFQTDFSDTSTGNAWSVLVRGMAHELTNQDDLVEAHQLGLRSWSDDSSNDRFVRIESRIVTGRRLRSAL